MTTKISYFNPVIPGFHPDPSVVKVGKDDYYLVTSSFEYFPGVPIFHSKDLINWEQIGSVLDRESQINLANCESSKGIYAPTIRYHNGTFYMITTDVTGRGNFYVTAVDPKGPWSDPISIPYGHIDPSLMFDDDGKVYVTVQNGSGIDSHIIQYEIDILTGEALSEPVVVCRGDGGVWTEAPHLYKIKGSYYLLCACGGTAEDHRAIIARSSNPYGPFELLDHPILTHNQLADHPIQNIGHADLVEDDKGNWWAVFLGVRLVDQEYGVLGRETFLAPVIWTEDGWPHIDNNEGTVSLTMDTERMLARTNIENSQASKDDFNEERLAPSWSFLRTKQEENYSLTDRPGWLRLVGNSLNLSDVGAPTFICKPQQHLQMEVSTLMEFLPDSDGEEAGLSVRFNEKAHYEICVKQIDGKRYVIVHTTIKGETVEAAREAIAGERIQLSIRADRNSYSFYFAEPNQAWQQLAKAPAGYLSPEKNRGYAGDFTGVCLGLYASANGRQVSGPAYFDYFHYEGLVD